MNDDPASRDIVPHFRFARAFHYSSAPVEEQLAMRGGSSPAFLHL